MRNNQKSHNRIKIKYFLIVPRTSKREHKTPARQTESKKSIPGKKKSIAFHFTPTKPHRREPRSAGRFEEKQSGRAERKERSDHLGSVPWRAGAASSRRRRRRRRRVGGGGEPTRVPRLPLHASHLVGSSLDRKTQVRGGD